MDNCNTCYQIEIPECTDQLTINGLTNLTAYDIFIKDVTVRELTRFQATSSGAGVLLVDTSSFTFSPAKGYELFVITPQNDGIENKEDITVSGTAYKCIGLEVCPVANVSGTSISFTNVDIN